ncbi:hypothetical protein C8Q74DRAFT_868337 [Fomes fomentarius]|nr:hypothetical protein C8Q74DRAFT_868337 [Fomes fomentarius]
MAAPISTHSQARQTLFIAEVFRNICSFASQGVLLNLAQCCKAFSDLAIQALWGELCDLKPLMGCFPDDAVKDHEREYHVLRPLRADDWHVFLKYALYIRKLGDSDPIAPGIPPLVRLDALCTMCALRPTMVLLPNVYQLHCNSLALTDTAISYLLSVIGESLACFDARLVSSEPGVVPAILSLLAVRPRLQHFTLSGGTRADDPEWTSAFASFLDSVPPLTTMVCDIIPVLQASIVRLAGWSTLRTVHIRLPHHLVWSYIFENNAQPFPYVETFSVTSTAASYGDFARAFSLPRVTTFSLSLIGPSSMDVPQSTFKAVRAQFDTRTLTSLVIQSYWHDISPSEEVEMALQNEAVVYSQDVRPLLEFNELRTLNVSLALGYAIDDELCRGMAKAWPRIQDLRFAHIFWCVHDPLAVTIKGLSCFATHCPDLHTLAMKFDAASWALQANLSISELQRPIPDEFYGELGGRQSTSKVKLLWIDNYPISGAPQVALYLLRIFPDLRDKWCDYSTGPKTDEEEQFARAWASVSHFLPVMAKSREDGQRMEREGRTP